MVADTEHSPTHEQIDPDPLILAAIAAITGSIAASLAIVDKYKEWQNTPMKLRRRMRGDLEKIGDALGHLQADVGTLRQIISDSQMNTQSRRLVMGSGMMVNRDQFRRWDEATGDIMGRLKTIVKVTNRLDRDLAAFPADDGRAGVVGSLDDATRTLEQILEGYR